MPVFRSNMKNRISTSLVSGLALAFFALFVIGTCFLNIPLLNGLMMDLEVIFLFIGVPMVAAASIICSWKLLSPNTGLRTMARFLVPLFLLVAVAAIAFPGVAVMAFLILAVSGVPILVLYGQAISCASLVRSGVSKSCTLLLIASVILAIAVWPVAVAVGVEKDPDIGRMLISPQILCWLVCAITATFLVEIRRKISIDGSDGTGDIAAPDIRKAIFLWVAAAMVWMIVLMWIEGITEKGSL